MFHGKIHSKFQIVIFNSYVKLPEGTVPACCVFQKRVLEVGKVCQDHEHVDHQHVAEEVDPSAIIMEAPCF